MFDSCSDFELLDSWGAGDREAGSALFQRHFPALYRFFRNKVDGAVQDLVQRTFLGCVEARERFSRESSFRSYLFQTARFQLYLHYREIKRDAALDFAVVSSADLRTSPFELIARKQDGRLLLQGLRRIPVDHQIVLELSFWEEMSGPEIARVLNLPEGTVRSRLRRAALRLREELTRLGRDESALRTTADDLTAWAKRVRANLEHPREPAPL